MQDSAWKYGVILGVTILILKGVEYYFSISFLPNEVYISIVVILVIAFGVLLWKKLTNPSIKFAPEKKSKVFRRNEDRIKSLEISDRELNVLELMSEGRSNQEIATKLNISINSVNASVSKLFKKLEVNRRSKAISKARKLKLIK
ncbi:MAG: LuxR C-terminal-related transcriptional regulator [Gracilimonas sp.]